MASESSKALEWTWDTNGALMPDGGLRLFRDCRLVSAAIILAAFPAIALASGGSLAVLAAMLLFGILPAAIALDVRNPAGLPRALVMSLIAAAAVLLGGVLRGLPPVPAMAMLGVLAIEAIVLGGARLRPVALAILAASMIATVMAGIVQPFGMARGALSEPLPYATMTMALVLVINVLLLARGLTRGLAAEQQSFHEQRIQSREIEAMVSETIVAADGTGAVIRVSGNAMRVLGLPAEALKGRGLTEMILVADRPLFLTALGDCVHSGREQTFRVRLRTSPANEAPRYRWIEVGLKASTEDSSMALATLRDIESLVAEEAQGRRATEAAEAGKSAQASFLTTVNHELRTPLNAIIGFSEFLANPATTPQSADRLREYAGIINGAGQDMLRIVNAMIDITRIDRGVYEFEPEPANVTAIVRSAVDSFRLEPEGKNTRIGIEAMDEPLDALVDQRAFRCVLHQVLSNAVKFGESSSPVVIRLSGDIAAVQVAITDYGLGISQEKLVLLGSHFARLDEGLNRERGGIGLGLSLASGLMALHRGRIDIASSPGQGTTVKLSLARLTAPASNILPITRNLSPEAPQVADHAPQRRIA
jgi:cell cycle sensor histidine kinase DivJ